MPYFNSIEECKKVVANDLNAIPDNLKNFTNVTRNNRSTNPWKRMIVGIVSCKKYQNRLENFLTIFSDIFAKFGLDYLIIYADPNLKTEKGKDFTVDHKNRIFIAKAKESYESLAHKLSIFYSYVYNHTDYDYAVKVDDGCLLNLKELITKLDQPYIGSTLKPTLNIIHKGKCTDKEFNDIALDFGHNFKKFNPNMDDKLYSDLYHINLAGGGYGYRLHRDALKHIDKYKKHVLSLGLSYEDVLFGQIMYIEGIMVTRVGIGRYHYIGPKQ